MIAATNDTRRNDVGEDTEPVTAARVARLVAEARQHMAAMGMHLSANKVSRLVRAHLAISGSERDLMRWVIAYADPTGETAVANVMRAQQ